LFTSALEQQCSCDVAFPPPNSSPSFEVSAIFPISEIGDIFPMQRTLTTITLHYITVFSARPTTTRVGLAVQMSTMSRNFNILLSMGARTTYSGCRCDEKTIRSSTGITTTKVNVYESLVLLVYNAELQNDAQRMLTVFEMDGSRRIAGVT